LLKKKVVPGVEPGLLDSKSKVLTITLYNQNCQERDSNPRALAVGLESTPLDHSGILAYYHLL
jgi:hypothetical protein